MQGITAIHFFNGYAPAKKQVIGTTIACPQSHDFKHWAGMLPWQSRRKLQMMDYSEKLVEVKKIYPFDLWRQHYENGLEQYTEKNVGLAKAIVDNLLASLVNLGESAFLSDKLELFRVSVEAMNELNDELDGCLIETDEREELCALYDDIAVAAGIDPTQYGEGDGIASEWRDW